MKWMFLLSSLVVLPFTGRYIAQVDFTAIPTQVLLEICYTVFVATFFTFLLVPVGQKSLRPTVVSSYNYVQPVMSTVVSLLWGLTVFGLVKGLAIALVFAGVLLVTRSKSRQQLEAERTKKEQLKA